MPLNKYNLTFPSYGAKSFNSGQSPSGSSGYNGGQGIVNYPTLISPIQFTLKHKLSMNTVWSEIKENHVL